jgi:hypothetical protein
MSGRLIAIGDIHGCHKEFEDLLDKLDLGKDDRLILLGDLINRGPDSGKVVELAREYATASLLGNHELRHLNFRRTDDPSHLKKYDYATMDQLRGKDWDYLEEMKLTYEDEELGIVFVHAGFLPDKPWQKQPARVVTRIQVVGKDGEPRKRLRPYPAARGGQDQVDAGHRHRLCARREPDCLHIARKTDCAGEGPGNLLQDLGDGPRWPASSAGVAGTDGVSLLSVFDPLLSVHCSP